MQRETALALLGIGVVLMLLLIGVAVHISTPKPVSPSVEAPSVTKPVVSPTPMQPTQTAAPVQMPTVSTPTLTPLPATPSVPTPVPSPAWATPSAPKVSAPSLMPPLQAPPPPLPLGLVGASPVPPALKETAAPPPKQVTNEALEWARRLLTSLRPQSQLVLIKSEAAWLGEEGFAVTVEPNGQLTVFARTPVGWLYGILDIVHRSRWRDPLPAQWRWLPPVMERGWVVDRPHWLLSPPRTAAQWRAILRDQLRQLSLGRFNTLVLRCDGREAGLSQTLSLLRQLAPDYGVRVVVWAANPSAAVQQWLRQGGAGVSQTELPNDRIIAVAARSDWVPLYAERGQVLAPLSPLVLPTLSASLTQVRHRERVIVPVWLDGVYRDVFWFDPAWAQQLIRGAQELKLRGIWVLAQTKPQEWAMAAFAEAFKNPQEDNEALWQQRWERQGLSAQWLPAFRSASRILPRLAWLGVSQTPQWGAPLDAFFTAQPIGSTWGKEWRLQVLSVPQTARLTERPKEPNTIPMDEIARWLEQHAQQVWTTLAQLPEPSAPDWRFAKQLALLNAWLGQHYAHKIDAALAWARFLDGDKEAGKECLDHLLKALKAWEQVVAVANTVYPSDNLWARRLPEWQQEWTMLRMRLAAAMP